MFRFFFYLALIGGLGYAATRVPVAGRTPVQHASSWWKAYEAGARNDGRRGAEAASAPAPQARTAEATHERGAPVKKTERAERTAPVQKRPGSERVAMTDGPPDQITDEDRRQLERLLPQ